jgi:hypothetical protein
MFTDLAEAVFYRVAFTTHFIAHARDVIRCAAGARKMRQPARILNRVLLLNTFPESPARRF